MGQVFGCQGCDGADPGPVVKVDLLRDGEGPGPVVKVDLLRDRAGPGPVVEVVDCSSHWWPWGMSCT